MPWLTGAIILKNVFQVRCVCRSATRAQANGRHDTLLFEGMQMGFDRAGASRCGDTSGASEVTRWVGHAAPYGGESQPINREMAAATAGSSGKMTGSSLVRTVLSPTRRAKTFTGQPQAL